MTRLLKMATCLLVFAFPGVSLAADTTYAEVFAYAVDNYPGLFSGTAVAGKYQQYSYLYYPTTGNYLALDDAGVVWMLGPATKGVITSLGPLTNFSALISAWKNPSAVTTNVSRFNGTYTGTIGGQRDQRDLVYGLTFTVLNGVVTVSSPAVGFTGRVTASGAFSASAVQTGEPRDCPGTLVLTGQITINTAGIAAASGNFFSPGVAGFCADANSSWSGTR